ncbi:MAG: hypothetical protein ACRDV3_02030 [Acidothermaceae bacterium]
MTESQGSTVATFAVLTVVAACLAIAALPWTPNVRSHFSKP